MENLFQEISQYGIAGLCVGYLIYFQLTTMKEIIKTLGSINERLIIIETHLGIKEKESGD